MAAALRAVAEATGPEAPAAVVAHSAGGVATAYAVRQGLRIGRAVFLAPAARGDTYAEGFAARLGLGRRIQARLRRRSEQRVGVPFSALDVAAFAGQLSVPLLVVHDEQDEEVPYRDGAELAAAWPGAQLVTTLGLGHHQILRDAGVMGQVTSFLTAGTGLEARSGSRSKEVLHANG
jgi:pimeloyl-ACP methyl ester carboxylesterase